MRWAGPLRAVHRLSFSPVVSSIAGSSEIKRRPANPFSPCSAMFLLSARVSSRVDEGNDLVARKNRTHYAKRRATISQEEAGGRRSRPAAPSIALAQETATSGPKTNQVESQIGFPSRVSQTKTKTHTKTARNTSRRCTWLTTVTTMLRTLALRPYHGSKAVRGETDKPLSWRQRLKKIASIENKKIKKTRKII